MIPPHEAAWEVHEFLTRAGLRYAIIGGVAIQHWGEPRLTVDLDVTVAVPLDEAEGLVRGRIRPRIQRTTLSPSWYEPTGCLGNPTSLWRLRSPGPSS